MKPVVVTTAHRGVFFGYLDDGADAESPKKLDLRGARNCLHWTTDTKGFLGLSVTGPGDGCRVGPKVDALTIYDITSVTPVSEKAVEAWERAPW